MQHTETYNFNIIERSDPFSPEALNENTRAVEEQLARVEEEAAAGLAALADRTTAASGVYYGNGTAAGVTVKTGFKPSLVIIFNMSSTASYTSALMVASAVHGVYLRKDNRSYTIHGLFTMNSDGFTVVGDNENNQYAANMAGGYYIYFAIR